MDRLIAANSVPFANRDLPPVIGTQQYSTNGDPVAGIPATTWEAYWINTLQDELIGVIAAGGIAPDRTSSTQLLAALKVLIQAETGNYAVDTGADGAHYVIAPNPPLLAYTDGLPLRFLAAHTSTGVATLAVSGLAAKTIVRDDGTALQAGDIPVNGIANVLYSLGADKFFLISTVQQNATFLQAQGGNYAADTGADGTHYACALTPALAAHSAGTPIRIKAAHTNTGASTFNPGPGAVAIVDLAGAALTAGAITAGEIIELKYDGGANYQLAVPVPATATEVKAQANATKYVTPSTLNAGRFTSALSGVLSGLGGVYSVAHGLGAGVLNAFCVLVCQTAENGYSIGDHVVAPNGQDTTTNRGVAVAWDGANVQAAIGSGGIGMVPKGGGAPNAITLANWKLYLVATL